MRQIDDYFNDIPDGLQRTQLMSTRYKRARISIVQRILRECRADEGDYKGNNGSVKTALLGIYNHCCAFCESRVGKYSDVEHFRPKHAITEANIEGTEVNTEGYYWLAVEWSNLLIACPDCNRDYKNNHFPIAGTRVTSPLDVDFNDNTSVTEFFSRNHIRSTELQAEKPLLLHPVLDNPDGYLVFQMDGTVTAKNGNIRGQTSIKRYGLSDWEKREILIQDRKKIVKRVRKEVYHAVNNYINDTRLYQDLSKIHLELIRELREKEPFSAVRRSCLVNFKAFFIDIFTGEQAIQLNRCYDRIKANLL